MVRFLTSVLRSPEPKKVFQNFNLCVFVVFAFARTVQISHIAPDQGFTRHANKPPISGVTRAIEMRMGTLQILSPYQPKLGIPRSRTNLSKHHMHLQKSLLKSIQVSESGIELFSIWNGQSCENSPLQPQPGTLSVHTWIETLQQSRTLHTNYLELPKILKL